MGTVDCLPLLYYEDKIQYTKGESAGKMPGYLECFRHWQIRPPCTRLVRESGLVDDDRNPY
jgi:hypothetical protein